MTHFEPTKNKILFGNTDKLADWIAEELDQSKIIDKIRLMLKNYLELDNVSFLFGSGTSIHLGAVAIRNFPFEVEKYIVGKDKEDGFKGIYDEFEDTIKVLQSDFLKYGKDNFDEGSDDTFKNEKGWKFYIEDEFVRDGESAEIALEYEKVLNYLIAKDFVFKEDKSQERKDKIGELITAIKEGLFEVCDLERRPVSQTIIDKKKASQFTKDIAQGELLQTRSKYIFHEKFIKAIGRAHV